MVNRPASKTTAKKWDRAPYDWYCESPRVVEQLMQRIDFGDDLIWDPCCGRGNVPDHRLRHHRPQPAPPLHPGQRPDADEQDADLCRPADQRDQQHAV
jgi:hypothetical protein